MVQILSSLEVCDFTADAYCTLGIPAVAMGLSSSQILSIIIIVYFAPALFVAVWICCHLGLGRQWGWLYLCIFTAARLAGSALQIASEDLNKPSLASAALYIGSLGVVVLLLVMLELLQRV
jgi:hypothetical protein